MEEGEGEKRKKSERVKKLTGSKKEEKEEE